MYYGITTPRKSGQMPYLLAMDDLGRWCLGGVEQERIQLNEESLWEGSFQDTNNPKALEALPIVQKLLFEDKNDEATTLAGETMLGVPHRIKSYQSLGDIIIDFTNHSDVKEYRRETGF